MPYTCTHMPWLFPYQSTFQGRIWRKFYEVFMENGNFSPSDPQKMWEDMVDLVLYIQENCDKIFFKSCCRHSHRLQYCVTSFYKAPPNQWIWGLSFVANRDRRFLSNAAAASTACATAQTSKHVLRAYAYRTTRPLSTMVPSFKLKTNYLYNMLST